ESANLDTVSFIKEVKNLSHLIKGDYQTAGYLDTAMKTALISLTKLSKDVNQSMSVLNAMKEIDQNLYYQSVANWVNSQQIPIKKLGLPEKTLLEIAPWLTYLEIRDGEYAEESGDLINCTYTDNFIGELLARTQKLTHLHVEFSKMKNALARLKNTEHLQELTI